jgi:hypothetical protein
MSTPPTGEDPLRRPSGPDGAPHGGQPVPPPDPPGYWQPAPQQPAYTPQGYGPGPVQQPAYGPFGPQQPPPWPAGQQPPAPPPDRTRRRLILALEAVGLAIAVGIATLVYVLSSTVLDPAAVERDVAAQFEELHGVALDLDCNRRMIVRPGADYQCDGVTADGEEIEIRISVDDDDGAYTWAED